MSCWWEGNIKTLSWIVNIWQTYINKWLISQRLILWPTETKKKWEWIRNESIVSSRWQQGCATVICRLQSGSGSPTAAHFWTRFSLFSSALRFPVQSLRRFMPRFWTECSSIRLTWVRQPSPSSANWAGDVWIQNELCRHISFPHISLPLRIHKEKQKRRVERRKWFKKNVHSSEGFPFLMEVAASAVSWLFTAVDMLDEASLSSRPGCHIAAIGHTPLLSKYPLASVADVQRLAPWMHLILTQQV